MIFVWLVRGLRLTVLRLSPADYMLDDGAVLNDPSEGSFPVVHMDVQQLANFFGYDKYANVGRVYFTANVGRV